jgi:hypothetical protein
LRMSSEASEGLSFHAWSLRALPRADVLVTRPSL